MSIYAVIEPTDVRLEDIASPQSGALSKVRACSLRPLAVNRTSDRLELGRSRREWKLPATRGPIDAQLLYQLFAQEKIVQGVADA